LPIIDSERLREITDAIGEVGIDARGNGLLVVVAVLAERKLRAGRNSGVGSTTELIRPD
jgi:hypothetical protein